MNVTLEIPDQLSFQLVYRLERGEPYAVGLDQGIEFRLLNTAGQGVGALGAIASYAGKVGAAKSILKLATRRRSVYLMTQDGHAVSIGWCTVGKCSYYRIENDAVVIGPIWTAEEARGKGLATKALQLAMNEFMKRGRSIFYIDTEKLNRSAQRVFEKCGFGHPIAVYIR